MGVHRAVALHVGWLFQVEVAGVLLQVVPHTAGAHPGLTGQFSLLRFPDSRESVVKLVLCRSRSLSRR
ncbi:Scr1 family TA system antitoxin-like transcriptional regulator [Streptomyces chryseus]|uniref:Scr1 family TA system antitoxin-like transcriptional regulator n=1 Tax=Streptomyces chryseus TaxID=68186 RepID=UPI001FCBF179|nr:Scr1 family TA system antitoxin-like transcriptional regulator [Streptomyces chryseus]